MTLSVIVDIADETWMRALPDIEALAETAARNAILHVAPQMIDSPVKTEIGVIFIDDDFMRDLNKQYRGKDKPTNVLSFPLGQKSADEQTTLLLGDVVLALQTVTHEVESSGKTLAAHTQHLIVHGVLHLLGHDHEGETDANAMESLEIEILDAMGIANPYTVPIDTN